MMTGFNPPPSRAATALPELTRIQRTPQRITITVSWQLHQRLLQRSDQEGRSLSNLAAHILEIGCT